MSTVHANGPDEAISRLAVMVAQGGEIPADKVDWLVGSALDLIVIASRYEDGSRRVSGLYEVPDVKTLGKGEPLRTRPLWEWEQTGMDEDGMLVGRYVERGKISATLRTARGLDLVKPITWEELQVLCGVEPQAEEESGAQTPVGPPTASKSRPRPSKPGKPGRPGKPSRPAGEDPGDSRGPMRPGGAVSPPVSTGVDATGAVPHPQEGLASAPGYQVPEGASGEASDEEMEALMALFGPDPADDSAEGTPMTSFSDDEPDSDVGAAE